MRLSSFLRPELVVTDLRAPDTDAVIRTLARHLSEQGAIPSLEKAEEGLRERETAHTTAMGMGMALPHATLAGLAGPVIMVAIAPEAIQFGPEDTEPVHVFFVVLSPPGHEREHIKLLARICRLARHPGFMDSLQAATTPSHALEIIERVDGQHV